MISADDINIKKAIAEKLNLSSFSSEQQEKIITKILENVSLKSSILLLDKLNEKEREEFSTLKGQENVDDFLKSKNIDIYSIVNEAIVEIVKDLKGKVN
jgi:hypothetical protein